jgi:general secretion pathway protein N
MNPLSLTIALAAAGLMIGGAEGQTRERSGTILAAIGAENPALDTPGAPDASPEAAAPREAAPPPPARAGNPLWAIPMRKLSATRERPLFSPSRRPPTPVIAAAPAPIAVVAPPPPEPENPPLVLVGTIIGENEKIAIFINLTSNETKRVREGEAEAGWILRSVELRTTVLERNNRSVTLDLPKRGGEPSPGSPTIPAAALPVGPGLPPGVEQTL